MTTIKLFQANQDHLPKISEQECSDKEVLNKIRKLKEELKDQLIILGHHYQQDEIIQFADISGDSLILAREAANQKKPYIIFCGVHFMAETADIISTPKQKIILPDLNAGCSMADMANANDVNTAWNFFKRSTSKKIVPITYINCSADLKAFVGRNGGSICTSSNAKKVIQWSFSKGEKLLFFPDQHLGRNTCFELGIPLDKMVLYDPNLPNGGLTPNQIEKAQVILWYGYCSVHQGFTKDHIDFIRKKSPKTKVIVHPECCFDVVQAADLNGSTAFIVNEIEKAPAGSSFAVGTEVNLVNRLAKKYKDKNIFSLSPYQCLCTTMYRIRPRWLLDVMQSIKNKKPINVIKVTKEIQKDSYKALNTMFNIK